MRPDRPAVPVLPEWECGNALLPQGRCPESGHDEARKAPERHAGCHGTLPARRQGPESQHPERHGVATRESVVREMDERRRSSEAPHSEQRQQDIHLGSRRTGHRRRAALARRQTGLLLPRRPACRTFGEPEESDHPQPADHELRTRHRASQKGGRHLGEDLPLLARRA